MTTPLPAGTASGQDSDSAAASGGNSESVAAALPGEGSEPEGSVPEGSEPADAELGNSQFAFWIDDTEGTPEIDVKAKDSAGTVYTGSINLTPAS